MARDEALLVGCVGPSAVPALRFYGWSPATVSLGYFQDYAEFESLKPPAGRLPVVRRTTGGGAILHDLELTYAMVIPMEHSLVGGQPGRLYALAHAAIIEAIGPAARLFGVAGGACGSSARQGPFFCFARRHDVDVVVDDARAPGGVSKIAGSAQRRTSHAVLQHGSIILDSRYSQQPAATWRQVAGEIAFEEAVSLLAAAFARTMGIALQTGPWTEPELDAARRLHLRYAGDAWTVRRERGEPVVA